MRAKTHTRWGVYPWAFWASGTETAVVDESRGFVVREMSAGDRCTFVPYSKLTPVKVYKSKAAAEKYADKLCYGCGVL